MAFVAKKYADIIAKSLDGKSLEEFESLINAFNYLLLSNKKFDYIINSPMIGHTQKNLFIKKLVLNQNKKAAEFFVNVLMHLIRTNSLKVLTEIANEIKNIILDKKNLTPVTLTFSATPDDKDLNKITQYLEKNYNIKPEISIRIDKSIIGGFRGIFRGKMIDATLLTTFTQLSSSINSNMA